MDNKQLDLPIQQSPIEPKRVRLPVDRQALTKKFTICGGDEVLEKQVTKCPNCGTSVSTMIVKKIDLDAYITVGFYPDGKVGEIFLKIGKAGGVYRAYDALCVAISIGLQYGIPLSVFVRKFQHMKFEPSGYTKDDPETGIPRAQSIPDYLAQWLKKRFLDSQEVSKIDTESEKEKHSMASIIPAPDKKDDNDGRIG